MIFKNGTIVDENFQLVKKDIKINGKFIESIEFSISVDKDIIDCQDKYIIPGLIDIHTHGGCGCDFCDNSIESYQTISDYLGQNGITSFLMTTLTLSKDYLLSMMKSMSIFMESNLNTAYPHGIYLEGPFCSKAKKGAQNEKYIIEPDINFINTLNKESGNNLKVVTISPELEGAMEFIDYYKDSDIVLSMAHTNANYEISKEGISRGIKHGTHLYNAMTPFTHRDPGTVGAILESDITAELICDGIHIHPSVISTTYKILGEDRLVLISDSMSAAGMKDGVYQIGGQDVNIIDGKATLIDGTIAGSTTNLMKCMLYASKSGIPFQKAVKAASYNPAKLVGVDNTVGSISIGKYADIVILNKDFTIDSVYIKGNKVKKGSLD